jgi:hypothetical protein
MKTLIIFFQMIMSAIVIVMFVRIFMSSCSVPDNDIIEYVLCILLGIGTGSLIYKINHKDEQ